MLEEFRSYLTHKARIKDKCIPYYLKWVSDFYTFFNHPSEHPLSNDQRQEFLKHIWKRHEEWNRGLKGSSEDSTGLEGNWKVPEEETRKALRLRHRSLSTEKKLPYLATS
jgi:hypothetical protein